jgi:hypothetical protein
MTEEDCLTTRLDKRHYEEFRTDLAGYRELTFLAVLRFYAEGIGEKLKSYRNK